MGISSRPAALPTLPSTTLHSADLSSSPRSIPSFKMMGLNSSTAGVEQHTAPAQSQYCLVRSICPGERSSPGAAFPLPCWLGRGFSGGGSVSRALPTRQTGRVSAPSAQNAPRMPCTGPKPRSAVRTKTVRNAPESPTAPPMTPVASPLRPLYHFWAQDWMEGYKKAVPSPAGTLNSTQNHPPAAPGRRAAAKNPPQSRAVPQSAARRGPFRSCRKPPITHPTPNAAIRMPNASPAPCSERPYSSMTGCWNTPQAAGRPVNI